jgi:Skp family chaperone for outer membrane proteins
MKQIMGLVLLLSLAACQSAYYGTAEKFGIHKRDILADRVEASRDAQSEARETFQSALEQLSALIDYDGGDLEKIYSRTNSSYERSEAAAEDVRERIAAVENVADALFREWEKEIEEYSNASLKASSQRKLFETRERYADMLQAMQAASRRMDPVLVSLKDNVLYLKHNLNARAVSAVRVEFESVERDIRRLIEDMERAIASSDSFIQSMRAE